MKLLLSVLLVLIFLFPLTTSALLGQTSTRAEFEEYCKLWEGRWIGDLIWTTDWPGMGKKGDKVTGYWEARIVADGNALSGVWYAGNGMGSEIWYFDTATKQIKGVGVSSGASIFNGIVYKKDGKWQDLRTGSIPDGSKFEEKSTLIITNDGKTNTRSGTGTIGGEKMDPLHHVWRRVSK